MPTRDQVESVIAEIERLRAEPTDGKPWDALSYGERYAALREIEWAGFSRPEETTVIGRVLIGEPPGLWMEGIGGRDDELLQSPDELRAPAEGIRGEGHAARVRDDGEAAAATDEAWLAEGADDEPVGFQVWHRRGGHYERVASVESNVLGAILMTTHGFLGYQRWQDNPGVTAMPGDHRSTDIGDVLIGPDGKSLEIAADDGLRLKPIAPVDRIPPHAKGMRPGPGGTPQERAEGGDRAPRPPDAFDRVAANPGREWDTVWQQWFYDFPASPEESWERQPAEEKIAFLADFAGQHDVSFERFAAGARQILGIEPGREFPADIQRYMRREFDRAQVGYAGYRADRDRRPDGSPERTPTEMGALVEAMFKDGFNRPEEPARPTTDIRVLPGKDNPLSWRDDRSFDIYDATGKIGHLAGYMGGPWSEKEFRVTHVENSEPGRRLSPGEWKQVLQGLRGRLPAEAELVGGNRAGEGGDLHPAYEKLFRLPELRKSHIDGRMEGLTEMNDNKESPLDRVERQLRERKEANGGLGTPSEAGNLRVLEQEIDWTDIDGRDKQAVLAREVDFSKMSRDELNAVYDAIAPDEIDERPARRLFDEANYARAVAEVERRPRTATVDFGIDSQEHYESLYYPIRNGEIAPSVLDAAMGHGAKLTELTRSAPSNPHKDLAFHTSWDVLLGRERGTGDGHRHLSPSEIIRCCKASPPAEPHRTADRDHADDNGRDR